jgi:transposase
MKRSIESDGRMQGTLFPEYLEDYVAEGNPVRVVDAFVENLGLGKPGFNRAGPAITGRPSCHPSVPLKLCIYGHLNRTQSSRRLEKGAQRNVELMWSLGRSTPDFKTIAKFRQGNGPAIRKVCGQFVQSCRPPDLFSEAMAAIDGSKFKAVNNRDRNYAANKIKRRRGQIETGIGRYLAALETADLQGPDIAEAKTGRSQEKMTKPKRQMEQLGSIEAQLQETPDKQISLAGPDARPMATSGRGTGMAGHNVQVAVGTKNRPIAAHGASNVGHDRHQLTHMAKQAKDAVATTEPHVAADRGHFSSRETLGCQQAGIVPALPKPATSGAKAGGRFGRGRFGCHPGQNGYSRPAGGRLKWRYSRIERGMEPHTAIGVRPASNAPSRRSARPTSNGKRPVGRMEACSRPCRSAWALPPRACGFDGKPSSTPSAP